MGRTIFALVALLAALVAAQGYLARGYDAANPRHTGAVSLVDKDGITPESITEVGLVIPGSDLELKYVLNDGLWRLPMYRDAYARGDMIEGIIKDIVDARGVPVDRRGRSDSFFGIGGKSFVIKIYVGGDAPVAAVTCGARLPGMWGRDSYARVAGREDVYHINGNPAAKIGAPGGLPPLVDGRIIPAALGSLGDPAEVIFEPAGVMPISGIVRRERSAAAGGMGNMPPDMRDMKQYDWFAVAGGREIKLDERSAGSYINFVRSINYSRIPRTEELAGGDGGPGEKRLLIVFEKRAPGGNGDSAGEKPERKTEYVEIRGYDGKGNRYVYFSGTGFTASVSSAKAALLFPDVDLLKNPQPSPSVFDRAESGEAPQVQSEDIYQ